MRSAHLLPVTSLILLLAAPFDLHRNNRAFEPHAKLLEEFDVGLKHPYCSGVEASKHGHMRELRVQHAGRPYRILYAFDPRRIALLLVGGDKTGKDRWYETFVPVADNLYDRHLEQLLKEGEM